MDRRLSGVSDMGWLVLVIGGAWVVFGVAFAFSRWSVEGVIFAVGALLLIVGVVWGVVWLFLAMREVDEIRERNRKRIVAGHRLYRAMQEADDRERNREEKR